MNTNTFVRDVKDKDAYLVEVQLKEGVPTAITYYDPKCGKTDLIGPGGGPGSASTPAPESGSGNASTLGSGNASTLGSIITDATQIENKELLEHMFNEYNNKIYTKDDYILVVFGDKTSIILKFVEQSGDIITLTNTNTVFEETYTIDIISNTLTTSNRSENPEVIIDDIKSFGKILIDDNPTFKVDGVEYTISKVDPADKSLNITVNMPSDESITSQSTIGEIGFFDLFKPDEIAKAIAAAPAAIAEASSSGGKKRVTRNRRRRRMRKSMRRFRSRAR